jgi:hypothetical protein
MVKNIEKWAFFAQKCQSPTVPTQTPYNFCCSRRHFAMCEWVQPTRLPLQSPANAGRQKAFGEQGSRRKFCGARPHP